MINARLAVLSAEIEGFWSLGDINDETAHGVAYLTVHHLQVI